jgi:hypothetical protein
MIEEEGGDDTVNEDGIIKPDEKRAIDIALVVSMVLE